MKKLMLIVMLFLAGCSTAGPYVTGISSDGKGNLIIQKGYTEYNGFLGVINNKEASESKVSIMPE